MARVSLSKIFLSASIPKKDRDKTFYDTMDVVAIRDCVKALATVVIPEAHLIWGGHPSITPLIRYVMQRMGANLEEHVTLYQSNFFEGKFPKDNEGFEQVVLTTASSDLEDSLRVMRNNMILDNSFQVGIFVGGMNGVMEEYELFRIAHPNALILPIASTGAAAKIIFDESSPKPDERLNYDYAYMALFRRFLTSYL